MYTACFDLLATFDEHLSLAYVGDRIAGDSEAPWESGGAGERGETGAMGGSGRRGTTREARRGRREGSGKRMGALRLRVSWPCAPVRARQGNLRVGSRRCTS